MVSGGFKLRIRLEASEKVMKHSQGMLLLHTALIGFHLYYLFRIILYMHDSPYGQECKKRTAITAVLSCARRRPTLTGGNPQLPSAQKLNFRVRPRMSMSGGSLRQLQSLGPRVYHTLRASFPRFLDLLAPGPSRV